VKQKYGIVFILIFINLGVAFAQRKEVVWTGKPEFCRTHVSILDLSIKSIIIMQNSII